jgi:hypothetical protein
VHCQAAITAELLLMLLLAQAAGVTTGSTGITTCQPHCMYLGTPSQDTMSRGHMDANMLGKYPGYPTFVCKAGSM